MGSSRQGQLRKSSSRTTSGSPLQPALAQGCCSTIYGVVAQQFVAFWDDFKNLLGTQYLSEQVAMLLFHPSGTLGSKCVCSSLCLWQISFPLCRPQTVKLYALASHLPTWLLQTCQGCAGLSQVPTREQGQWAGSGTAKKFLKKKNCKIIEKKKSLWVCQHCLELFLFFTLKCKISKTTC